VRVGRAAGITDTGRRRLRNEDAFVCEPPFFAVADGMGGARAGEIAARLAASALEESAPEARGQEGVVALIEEANRRIWERAVADPATAGMGTTVTAALVDGDAGQVAIGHVGDSRAYRLRDGALEQLTTDHSLVAELVQSGVLTPEEAERHPQRSAITRALGTEPSVEVEAFTVAARTGDLFLLCSDGLPTMLADDEVVSAIERAAGDPAAAAETLVAAANAHGGEDNITVVLFELVAGDASAADATEVAIAVIDQAESVPPEGNAASADDPEARRHGAGPGGRAAALALVAAVLVLGVLGLYWGIGR
jgi:serine/threonine protein phosphatase PrpC